MRLDLFLKRSRLVKRRSLAKGLCEDGAVRVNEHRARAGRILAVGDRLTLSFWNRRLEVEVTELPEKAPTAATADTLYRVISDERIAPEDDAHA